MKTILLRTIVCFLYFLFVSKGIISAQSISLNGKIIDANTKESIVGATVLVKGSREGTTSDLDGVFLLETQNKLPITLTIRFIGYREQKIDVYQNDFIEIALVEDLNIMNEVVVIGYGIQRRRDFTGSLASVPASIKELPFTSAEKLLQGTISGVQVTQASGQPGGGISIRVRGGTSINAGSEPLYVIDGFPIYNSNSSTDAGVASGERINPLSSLNPSDIESIDVLKDASATAIYGSRGANGVVIITTKRGKNNESKITYDTYIGSQNVTRKLPLLNASQWGVLKNDARIDAGKTPLYTETELIALGEGSDWQDAAFRSAFTQNHNLSIFTGTEKSRLSLSGNYFEQEGILLNTGFTRYSGRLNFDHEYNSHFKFGAFLTGSQTHSNIAPNGAVEALLEMPPTVPITDEKGNYTLVSNFETSIGNPINTLINQINEADTRRFLLNGYGEYRILNGLTAKMLIGGDFVNNKQNRYLPSTVFEGQPAGIASIGSLTATNWLNENTLTYKTTFGSKHAFDVLVGNTQQHSSSETYSASTSNFVNDSFTFNDLGSGTILRSSSSSFTSWSLLSYLGRINYGFDDKYLFTFTVRSDASSRFGKNNKWGTFPSVAFAWNATSERFIQSLKPVSSFKIRLSAGLTGNQEIPPYSSLARLSYYRYNFDDKFTGGFAPSTYGNPDLGWEKTAQYNMGIDIGLYNERISLIADIYYKRTNNLLLEVPLPYSSGVETAFQNYGSIENKGIELTLHSNNLTGAFAWNTDLVFSSNRNKVLSLGPGVIEFVPTNPSNNARTSEIVRVGEPLGNYFMYFDDGLFQEGDDFSLSPSQNTKAGSQKYKDVNGDGQITQAGDVTIVGNSQPKFLAGITNTFKYKNFDLNIFFQSSYGNKIFNNTKALLEIGSGFTGASIALLDRWTPTHTNTDMHRAIEDPSPTLSDRFVEDGSYLRLKNIALGYSLPSSFLNYFRVKSLRVYVSAQNLLTLTNYSGYDPEVSRNGQDALNSGFDYGGYPNSKTILGGLSISF